MNVVMLLLSLEWLTIQFLKIKNKYIYKIYNKINNVCQGLDLLSLN